MSVYENIGGHHMDLSGCVAVTPCDAQSTTPCSQSEVMLKTGVHHTNSAPSRAEIKEQPQPSAFVPPPPGLPTPVTI